MGGIGVGFYEAAKEIDKVDNIINDLKNKSASEQVDWYNSVGSKDDKNASKFRYEIQENLGESIESYAQRRDEAMRRDELRKRMLGLPGDDKDSETANVKKQELG